MWWKTMEKTTLGTEVCVCATSSAGGVQRKTPQTGKRTGGALGFDLERVQRV